MAEQANVCLKNLDGTGIDVVRRLANGTIDLNMTIPGGQEDTILLPEPGVYLEIGTPGAPNGKNTQNCVFNVILNEDVVDWSAMDDYHWKMQMSDNSRPPEVPTEVNVEIGEEPPAP